jgi:hypothetical protein
MDNAVTYVLKSQTRVKDGTTIYSFGPGDECARPPYISPASPVGVEKVSATDLSQLAKALDAIAASAAAEARELWARTPAATARIDQLQSVFERARDAAAQARALGGRSEPASITRPPRRPIRRKRHNSHSRWVQW